MSGSLAHRRPLSVLIGVFMVAALCVLPATRVGAEEGEREKRGDIFIRDEVDFNPANGVRSGSGTKADPYVISGWDVRTLYIKDTASYVDIYNNSVRRMVLDWVGDRVHVHHNDIGDLRVNQNVRRKGDATSGVISHNRFGTVGQLRHWDGVFSHNIVGTRSDSPIDLLFRRRAVNFDGFNGAIFAHNVIYGYMDARLHGHHHSSRFGGQSHYHGAAADDESSHNHSEAEGRMATVDHSQRYHEVTIRHNTIHSDARYALAYLDTAHAANDRTAASEDNEALNKAHVHHTRVHIEDNRLIGSGLLVLVFNADDERHKGTAPGLVEIKGNRIALSDNEHPFSHRYGIAVERARDLSLQIVDNVVVGPDENELLPLGETDNWWNREPAGIDLYDLDKGMVHLYGNRVAKLPFGIRAHRMTESVHWVIRDLKTEDVDQDVYWDSTVKNQPKRD